MCLYEDRTNVLWIGTRGEGMCKLDLRQKKFYRLSNSLVDKNSVKFDKVTSICIDSKKNFWLGTFSYGMYKSKIENVFNSMKFPNVEKKSVYCIIEDNNKKIWIASELHGLCSYDQDNDKFEVYSHEKYNFKEIRIFPLLQDKFNKNLLWIGTDSNGLFLFDTDAAQRTPRGPGLQTSKTTAPRRILIGPHPTPQPLGQSPRSRPPAGLPFSCDPAIPGIAFPIFPDR
jgi:ligand-binding sensor domain-containing protein